jgi:hypothetical protein
MKSKIAAIGTSALLLVLIIVMKMRLFPDASRETDYYLLAAGLATAMFLVVSVISLAAYLVTGPAPPHKPPRVSQDQREAFRIGYPPDDRPFLQLANHHHETPQMATLAVLDLSEYGLRFRNDAQLPLSTVVTGDLAFSDGVVLPVSGRIVRQHADEISLKLSTPIPYNRIINEQRRLLLEPPPGDDPSLGDTRPGPLSAQTDGGAG